MIASRPAGSQPPQRPSAESASPSSCSAPVTATIAASPRMVATATPQSGSAAARNATPTPATQRPTSGNNAEARRSSPAPSAAPPSDAPAGAPGTGRRVRKETATQNGRSGAAMAASRLLLLHLHDRLDLDGNAEGQGGDADGGAGVAAGLAEHLAEQLAGAVDHLGVVGEAGLGGDEAGDLDHAADPAEVAQLGLERGQHVDGAHPGGGGALVDAQAVGAEPAGPLRLPADQRHLAGDVEQVAGADAGDVRGHRRGRLGQLDAELAEALLRGWHFGLLYRNARLATGARCAGFPRRSFVAPQSSRRATVANIA